MNDQKRKFQFNTTSYLSPISSAENVLNIIPCQYTVNNEDESLSFNTELRCVWLLDVTGPISEDDHAEFHRQRMITL